MSARPKTVLVTGAAGTVGGYVMALAESAGFRVVANERTKGAVRVPVRGEVRPGDLTHPGVAESLVQGCDIVIHTAAQLDVGADVPELSRVNTDAVVALYEAAQAAHVRRFVHVSTALLYAAGHGDPLAEAARVTPRGTHGMSKHAAEVFLQSQSRGLEWAIVRAAPIYGRRGRHFAATLLAIGPLLRLFSPVLTRFHSGPRASMTHAEDVASALLFLATHENAAGEVFNVCSDEPMPLGDRVTETFRAYGLSMAGSVTVSRAVGERLRTWLSRPFGYRSLDSVLMALWRLVVLRHGLKPAFRPRLDREAVTLFCDDLAIDCTKLRRLGWSPRFERFADGWRDVLRWYQAERWVPRY